MKWFLLVVAIFLLLGSIIITRAHQLDLREEDSREEFLFTFSTWVFSLGGNVKDLVGFAIVQDWLPEVENGNDSTIHG